MRNDILTALMEVIKSRKDAQPDRSYVASLHQQGVDAISEKVVEEANETAQAAAAGDIEQIVYESADLWFHSLVLLSRFDLTHHNVLDELSRRFGVSGLEEKKSRS